jgi:GT2 family glycosyltransferase
VAGRELISCAKAMRVEPGRTVDLSVCVTSWNVGSLLRECLASLDDHGAPDDGSDAASSGATIEVIVVDNASTDPEVERVRAELPGLHWIQNATNRGYAAACNQAIAVARGRYVLLLNNDCRVRPGALQEMVRFMDRHPEAGVGSCMIFDSDTSREPAVAGCRHLPGPARVLIEGFADATGIASVLRRVGLERRLFGTDLDPHAVQEVRQITGAVFMIRRQVLEEVGLLDEGYFLYLEETDYCTRIARRGWKVLYNPAASVIHRGSAAGSLRADREELFRRSMTRYLAIHHGALWGRVYEAADRLAFQPLRAARARVVRALRRLLAGHA